jgi:diadenylate cyclase
LGLSEQSDAVVIVVSEETGIISLAIGGELERELNAERLQKRLTSLFARNGQGISDYINRRNGR